MQLRKPHALGVLDHHQRCIGDIDADLDDRGCHQQLEFVGEKPRHDFMLLGGLHAAMNEADTDIGKCLRERFQRFHCGFQLQGFGFLDQRAHPIRLSALLAGFADSRDYLVAARFGNQFRHDRRAARRQFVDDRDIEIGKVAHRERARDRRGAHHQLMRLRGFAACLAFFAQRQALADAESVLFVDDRQSQFRERHTFLKQGVRADSELGLAG